MRRHLIIFARSLRLGVGKRRLAADVGDVDAVQFQRIALRHMLRRLRSPRWRITLAIVDRSSPWKAYGSPRMAIRLQGSGDLGQRMARVAREATPGPVVIIGSDIPGIDARDIASAFGALGRHDMVFGPAADGGYWLVGLRRRPRFIDPFCKSFRTVRWSTEHALSDTLAGLDGLSIGYIRQREDIDNGAALARHNEWRLLTARS